MRTAPPPKKQRKTWVRVVFFYRGIGPSFKNPVALSIYLSLKKTSALPLGLSIYLSKKRAPHFFCSPPHAFVGFLKDEKWHVGPGFTPVSGKSSRGNGPQMASSGISSHFLQPIYLSLQKTGLISKSRAPLNLCPYLRGKNETLFASSGGTIER